MNVLNIAKFVKNTGSKLNSKNTEGITAPQTFKVYALEPSYDTFELESSDYLPDDIISDTFEIANQDDIEAQWVEEKEPVRDYAMIQKISDYLFEEGEYDKTDEECKKVDEASEALLKKLGYYDSDDITFKNGMAFRNDTQDAFSGVVLCHSKNNSKSELHYENGILKKSIRYFKDGRNPQEKTYSYMKKLDGGTVLIVRINDGSDEKILTTRKDKNQKQSGFIEINHEKKEKTEKMRIFPYHNGYLLFDGKNDKTRVVLMQNGKKKEILNRDEKFPLITDERHDKNGYTINYLNHNVLKK